MNDQVKGLLFTTLGVLLVVPDSLFVRLIEADPLVTAFWRGMTSGLLILVFVLVFMGVGAMRQALSAGTPALLYTLLIGSTTIGFVMAVTQTSVANVVFIFATVPVFAVIFSRIFLAEPIRPRMVWTMLVVMIGLGVIAFGSTEGGLASWQGDLWALYVSAAYAGALTAARSRKDISMVPAIPVAYVGAALMIWLFSTPLPDFAPQWELFVGHGAFIGLASCLLTLGPRYISSSEVSLLILLESVLAPLLVWAVIGEDPGPYTLAGGVIVIGALVVSNIIALRRAR